MHGRIADREMRLHPSRVTLALRAPGWGFHTVRRGTDAGGHRFRLRLVGVVAV